MALETGVFGDKLRLSLDLKDSALPPHAPLMQLRELQVKLSLGHCRADLVGQLSASALNSSERLLRADIAALFFIDHLIYHGLYSLNDAYSIDGRDQPTNNSSPHLEL